MKYLLFILLAFSCGVSSQELPNRGVGTTNVNSILVKIMAGEEITQPEALEVKTRKEKAEKILAETLKDPVSAQFHQGAFWETEVRETPKGRPFSVLCGVVNAKNSYGAYLGFKAYYVRTLLDDGTVDVIRIINSDSEMPIPIAINKDFRFVQKAAVECLGHLKAKDPKDGPKF